MPAIDFQDSRRPQALEHPDERTLSDLEGGDHPLLREPDASDLVGSEATQSGQVEDDLTRQPQSFLPAPR